MYVGAPDALEGQHFTFLGTPSFFIEGRHILGGGDIELLKGVLVLRGTPDILEGDIEL